LTGNSRAYSIRKTFDDGFIVAGVTASNHSDVAGNYGNWLYTFSFGYK